jgi:nitroimidazol reductase NimA-like FMN-containing flavoprotein (pyridoxamine 5'-phosphate oxidase superfamily)
MLRRLSTGAPACVTVTILDGLVLARSAFEHSANYDSVVLLGSFEAVSDDDEKLAALEAFLDGVIPGRWHEVRQPNRKELRATAVLALRIDEASVKTRTGPPDDDASPDAARDVWAGVIPVTERLGKPVGSPGLRAGIAVSPSVVELKRRSTA